MTDSNRLTDLVARLNNTPLMDCTCGDTTDIGKEAAAAIEGLMAAIALFIAYDETDDENGAAMMVRYDEAIRAARAALGEKK